MGHSLFVIGVVIICVVDLSLGAPLNNGEGSLMNQCLRELGLGEKSLDDLDDLELGLLSGKMDGKYGGSLTDDCKSDLNMSDLLLDEFTGAIRGQLFGLMDEKYAQARKTDEVKEMKDELAVNEVQGQIKLLEHLFKSHMSMTAASTDSSAPGKPKTKKRRQRIDDEMKPDKRCKLWLSFFAECTHPDFLQLKEKVVRPNRDESEEERLKKEEDRIKSFVSGISATYSFLNYKHGIRPRKGKYTTEQIKAALRNDGLKAKPILDIVDPIFLIDVRPEVQKSTDN